MPPSFANRAELESSAKRGAASVFLGGTTALCRVLDTYKMYVDTRDISVTPHLLLEGMWEPWITLAALRIFRHGMRVVNVGANFGYYTLLAADIVGRSGQVMAFEPNPVVARHLRMSVRVNGMEDRVLVSELAVTDSQGSARMSVPNDLMGGASLLNVHRAPGETILVETTTLDRACDGWDVDVVFADIEGCEQRMWRGMQKMVARGRPLTMVLEFEPAWQDEPRTFMNEVVAAGFRNSIIDDTGMLRRAGVDELCEPGLKMIVCQRG